MIEVSLGEIPKPIVLICNTNHFNYTSARSYGYNYQINYLAGNTNRSRFTSWSGQMGNITSEDLMWILYPANFSDVTIYYDWNNDGSGIAANLSIETLFVPSHGFCRQLTNLDLSKKFYIESVQSIKVLLYDSDIMNPIQMKQTPHLFAQIKVLGSNHFSAAYYEVDYQVHDSLIFAGVRCVDYQRIGSSYAGRTI